MKKNAVAFNLIYVGALILILISVEMALRILNVGYGTEPFRKVSIQEQLFYTGNPGYMNLFYPGSGLASSGFVNEYAKNLFPAGKTPGSLRGFVVGESTPEGYPYLPNQNFSKILENALIQTGDYSRVNVVNLGFSAQSSFFVVDTVKKVLRYKPDFIIVYSGHNEFYGTLNISGKSSAGAVRTYLFLKEFRIFQILFSIIERKTDFNHNFHLMENQFDQNRIADDSRSIGKVVKAYSENIREIIRACDKNGTKLILVEPVCNLIDMPPFSAVGNPDAVLSNLSTLYLAGKKTLPGFLEPLLAGNPSNRNAVMDFLLAKWTRPVLSKVDLEIYRDIKDRDSTPFRAKSVLIEALRRTASEGGGNCTYVRTEDRLVAEYGPASIGNELFVDHVHLNFKGEMAVAKILAESIMPVLTNDTHAIGLMENYLTNEFRIRESLDFLPIHEMFAYETIRLLIRKPPFSMMPVPFQPDFTSWRTNALAMDSNFVSNVEQTLETDKSGLYFVLLEKMYERNLLLSDRADNEKLFLSDIFITPGNYSSHINLANFYQTFPNAVNPVYVNFGIAYSLSGYDRRVKNAAEEYFNRIRHPELLEKWLTAYGR
jgi:hypothetical protein